MKYLLSTQKRKKTYKYKYTLPLLIALVCALQPNAIAAAYDLQFYAGNEILHFNPEEASLCSTPDVQTVSSGPTEVDVAKNFTLGTAKSSRPVELLKQLMIDFNFKDFQAAGIVGNFMHESGGAHLPPNINEGGEAGPPKFSGGYGWAQWTGGRQTAFIDFAVQGGYMASKNVSATDAANYAWLTYELTKTAEKAAVPAVKGTTNVSEAAAKFEEVFERAGVVANESRDNHARDVLNAYKNGTGVTGTGGSTTTNTNESSGQECSNPGSSVATGASGTFGEVAFPLKGTKSVVVNSGMFHSNTADQGGHPYIAYDIITNTRPEVVAFASGTVTYTSSDRCGGKFLTIWNDTAKLGVTYMHLSDHIENGATVNTGDHVGTVGTEAAGCGTEHLHIDAATDRIRQPCARTGCSESVKNSFRDIGADLFNTYQALPG